MENRRENKNPALRRGLFVAGTDTGVGKTVISRAILRLAVRKGKNIIPCKPVESGCAPDPLDALALRAAARCALPIDFICPFPLRTPVAPSVAAQLEGQTISVSRLVSHCDTLAAPPLPSPPALLIEAAGGLLTPIRGEETFADLAGALCLPILVVSRNSLGTINQTALVLESLAQRGLPLLGTVLVDTTAIPGPDRPHNAAAITVLTGVAPMAEIPFLPGATDDQLADALAATGAAAPILARL